MIRVKNIFSKRQLERKIEELERIRKRERDILDVMGHELRTPATVIKVNAELLEQYVGSNSKEFKKYLDRIKDAIESEIRLIDRLLNSAKLEGGKFEIEGEEVDLVKEIDAVVHNYKDTANNKGIELTSTTGLNIPTVYADRGAIIEVLNNLVDNAIKYTDQGKVSLITEVEGNDVKVSVVDTGMGIPEEEIPKLGGKFYRVDNYIEGKDEIEIVRPGGTGLGLYITFQLVKLMGGRIWVESKVGQGSKFIFTLPTYSGDKGEKVVRESVDMFERMGLKKE